MRLLTLKTVKTSLNSREEEDEMETLAQAKAKAMGKEKVQPKAPQGCVAANAYSHSFNSKDNEKLMEGNTESGFIVERNIDLDTFRL